MINFHKYPVPATHSLSRRTDTKRITSLKRFKHQRKTNPHKKLTKENKKFLKLIGLLK